METELIPLVMGFFEVNRPMAYLIVCVILSTPLHMFVFIRLGYHAMHFDTIESRVKQAQEVSNKTQNLCLDVIKMLTNR